MGTVHLIGFHWYLCGMNDFMSVPGLSHCLKTVGPTQM